MTCRGCGEPLNREDVFCDLGMQPPANQLLTEDQLDHAEIRYPLRALVCRHCLLVQLAHTPPPDALFPDDYPFFSGQSATWMAHCRRYADMIIDRLKLGPLSRVIEVGSNDGTMLARFRGRGIPALGVEPSGLLAEFAQMDGFATICDFWTEELARRISARHRTVDDGKADLVIANNVLAHVPDLHDFLRGVRAILRPDGVATFEVPWIANLIRDGAFDQVYHEHHCYFSMSSLNVALRTAGLVPVDVELVGTHGGSLRVFAQARALEPSKGAVRRLLLMELNTGLQDVQTYLDFASQLRKAKHHCWWELVGYPSARIVGYGASAKAATLLNYLGAGPELIEFIADTTPAKQRKWLPGSRIPIVSETILENAAPDVVVNFCWNWRQESEKRIRQACPNAEILYLNERAGCST